MRRFLLTLAVMLASITSNPGRGICQSPASSAAAPAFLLFATHGPARLLLSLPVEKDLVALPLSKLLLVRIEVNSDRPLQVEAPKTWLDSAGLRITQVSDARVSQTPQGMNTWQMTFAIDPLAPGTHDVQLNSLRVQEGDAPPQTIAWKSFKIAVSPTLAEPDLKYLRDDSSIEELPDQDGSNAWPWVISAVLMVVFAGILLRRWRRPRLARARLSPEQHALHELDRLQRMQLTARAEEFHTLLANIVRRFLERKHALPARKQTTPEFLASLDKNGILAPAERDFLRDFLQRCDLAKFAGIEVPASECDELLAHTRTFITSN